MYTEHLLRLSRRLHAAQDLDALMREVIEAVAAATGYRHAWLAVFSADGGTFEVVGTRPRRTPGSTSGSARSRSGATAS